MNYIKKLEAENKALRESIDYAVDVLIEYQRYYNSGKFQGKDNDYAHVSTDVYPRISQLKMYLAGSTNHSL